MNPKHDDPGRGAAGLVDVAKVCNFYRNLMIEADFNDEPELAAMYEKEYKRLCDLIKRGRIYEPSF